MNLRLNKLRNATIDRAITLLDKAKATPNPLADELDSMLSNPELTDDQKLQAIAFLHQQIKEMNNA